MSLLISFFFLVKVFTIFLCENNLLLDIFNVILNSFIMPYSIISFQFFYLFFLVLKAVNLP